jgi:hypothetical protein
VSAYLLETASVQEVEAAKAATEAAIVKAQAK